MPTKKKSIITKIIRRGLPVMAVALLLVSCGKNDNKDELAYRTYGITCLNNGDYEEAVSAFESALGCTSDIGETEIDINLYKAKAQYLSGDIEGAKTTYTNLIDYNEYSAAYYQRGNLFLAQGDHDSAIADYDAAIKKDAKNYELYIGIYESLHASGYEEEGLSYLTKGQNVSGEKGKDHMYKGLIAYRLGNTEEAIKLLETAIEQDQSRAYFYLSDIYRELGDRDQAAGYLNDYMKCEDVNADELVLMGQKELAEGKYEEAILFLEAASKSENVTDRQQMLKDLVIAYENKGDFASALTVLEGYVKDYPKDYKAADELTFLRTR